MCTVYNYKFKPVAFYLKNTILQKYFEQSGIEIKNKTLLQITSKQPQSIYIGKYDIQTVIMI